MYSRYLSGPGTIGPWRDYFDDAATFSSGSRSSGSRSSGSGSARYGREHGMDRPAPDAFLSAYGTYSPTTAYGAVTSFGDSYVGGASSYGGSMTSRGSTIGGPLYGRGYPTDCGATTVTTSSRRPRSAPSTRRQNSAARARDRAFAAGAPFARLPSSRVDYVDAGGTFMSSMQPGPRPPGTPLQYSGEVRGKACRHGFMFRDATGAILWDCSSSPKA